MKKLVFIILSFLLFPAAVFAAPAAVTDLKIDPAATGFRHIGITWTTPYDAVASTTPAYYEIRISTFRPIVTETDWNTNSGSTAYPYRINLSTAGITAGQNVSCVVTGLADGQTYFFAIKSSTDNVNWSPVDTSNPEPWGVAFDTSPAVVGGQNYINGAIAATATPTLTWVVPMPGSPGGIPGSNDDVNYGDSICSYNVQVSRFDDFSDRIEQDGITDTFWTTRPLVENASYYWRVQAFDLENSSSKYSVGKWFRVNAVDEPPSSFALTSPINSQIVATVQPVFQWAPSADPDPGDTVTYTLSYSSAPDFPPASTTIESGISTNQYQPVVNLEENATYWWKVDAVDKGGHATMSSSTATVRINSYNEQPMVFSAITPIDGTKVLVSTPTLTWQQAVDPDPGDYVTYSVLYSSSDTMLVSAYAVVNGLIDPGCILPALQEDTTYYWRVQAVDTHLALVQTVVQSFYVDAVHGQPSAFDLLSSSGIVPTARPAFSWQASGDVDNNAITYTVIYSTYADFSFALSSANLSSTQFIPAVDLIENSTYYWKVRADNPYGLSRLSNQTWAVGIDAVNEPPSAFNLLVPADGASATYLKPTFVWENSVDPDLSDYVASYTLYYSSAADFSVQAQVTGIGISSYTFSAMLTNATTYYWRVQALTSSGQQLFSNQSRHFVTQNQPPASFNLIAPSGMLSTSTVAFSWSTSVDPENDPVTYTLYYSTSVDFSHYVSSAGLVATHCTLAVFAEDTVYYWYVEAADTWGNRRQASQTMNFNVNAVAEPPAPFALTAPNDGTTVTTLFPQLAWQATSDTDIGDTISYVLWYSPDPSFAVKTQVGSLTSPSYRAVSALAANTTYYWRVYAVAGNGTQQVSATRSFFVQMSVSLAPPAVFTTHLSADRHSVTLSWAAVTKTLDGTAIAEVPGYRIYKAYDFNSLFTAAPLVSVSTGTLTWTDTDVRSLPVYYLVRAYALSGDEGCPSVVQRTDQQNLTYSYTDDQALTVAYPPEVISSSVSVVITRRAADENGDVVGSFQVAVQNAAGSAVTATFAQPVTLTFKLPAAGAGAAKKAPAAVAGDFAIYWFNGVEWVALGGTVNNDVIAVKTSYTGRYQLRSLRRTGAFSVLKAWPKIITPNGDGINDEFNLTFDHPAGDAADGKIFDLTGNRVARMQAKSDSWLFWDGKNDEEKKMQPGIYLYQVTCGGSVYNGTVVVAR